jgi:DNA-binding beta-propeller fold protein YncE
MRNRALLALMSLLCLAVPALAQDGPPMPEITGEIVIEGLNGPQGVYVAADGSVYVIDSGLGGEETTDFVNPETFEVEEGTFGETARVARLSTEGEIEEVATLPSVLVGTDAGGGARITELDGVLYATVGAWQGALGDEVTIDHFSAVVAISEGGVETIADLWAHELANNPDGTTNYESHPYGITAGPDGRLYVADAAANAVIAIDPASGEMTTVAVFDALPGVFPNPFRDNQLLTDPVPTAVAFDAEGTMFVSLLSGAPFIPGSAKVMQVADDGSVSDFAPGLTMLTDLQMGPDGNLYAVSFGMFTQEGPVFNSGSVIRILADGTAEVVIDGLPFATALAFDAEGSGYVTVNGVAIPNAGMVIYYAGLTEMAGEPLPPMGS